MVYKIENDLYDDDDDDYQCSVCFSFSSTQKQQSLNSNFKTQQQQQQQQQQPNNQQKQHTQKEQKSVNILSSKDFVGNNKEFRMESNKCNLRIIGNGNRIRIAQNSGCLQIIGNSTRLKIAQNSGSIKYTGNEGRICLGSESTQQMVDYIGCNGLLKVINSTEFNKSPTCSENSNNTNNNNNNSSSNSNNSDSNNTPISHSDKVIENNSKRKHLTGNAVPGTSPQQSFKSSSSTSSSSSAAAAASAAETLSSFKPRAKSASFEELINMKEESWKHFADLFQHNNGWQHFAKVSLPDLKDNINEQAGVCDCKCKKAPSKKFFNNLNKKAKNNNENRNKSSRVHLCGLNIGNHSNVVNHFGDIVIKNSVNVSIA